jgi:hypothetical protein
MSGAVGPQQPAHQNVRKARREKQTPVILHVDGKEYIAYPKSGKDKPAPTPDDGAAENDRLGPLFEASSLENKAGNPEEEAVGPQADAEAPQPQSPCSPSLFQAQDCVVPPPSVESPAVVESKGLQVADFTDEHFTARQNILLEKILPQMRARNRSASKNDIAELIRRLTENDREPVPYEDPAWNAEPKMSAARLKKLGHCSEEDLQEQDRVALPPSAESPAGVESKGFQVEENSTGVESRELQIEDFTYFGLTRAENELLKTFLMTPGFTQFVHTNKITKYDITTVIKGVLQPAPAPAPAPAPVPLPKKSGVSRRRVVNESKKPTLKDFDEYKFNSRQQTILLKFLAGIHKDNPGGRIIPSKNDLAMMVMRLTSDPRIQGMKFENPNWHQNPENYL